MSKHGDNYNAKNATNLGHIMNKGVPIQVHHLISQSKYAALKVEHKAMLCDAQYDIHDTDNLVGLPSTVAAACQLEVQLHKGNHTGFGSGKSYHKTVEEKINEVFDEIDNNLKKYKCANNDSEEEKKRKEKAYKKAYEAEVKTLKDTMHDTEEYMLDEIKGFTSKLTAQAIFYKSGNVGCCGTSIGAATENIAVSTLRTHAAAGTPCTQPNRAGAHPIPHYEGVQVGGYRLERGK